MEKLFIADRIEEGTAVCISADGDCIELTASEAVYEGVRLMIDTEGGRIISVRTATAEEAPSTAGCNRERLSKLFNKFQRKEH